MSRRNNHRKGKGNCDSAAPGYEVGYGRPPVHTRFKPGQSGNPKGRRKGSKSPKAVLEEVLARPITILEGGRRRTVKQVEAIFMALTAKALRGDLRAANQVFKLMTQFGITGPDGGTVQPIIMEITETDLRLIGLTEPPPNER